MATVAQFPVEDYREELEAASGNYEVGTRLLFENDRVRVWELRLEPGGRVPFHCHRTPYFWVCHEGTRGIQRFPDGTMMRIEFAPYDTDFLDEERLETERIHDIENTGDSPCRFTTFEILR